MCVLVSWGPASARVADHEELLDSHAKQLCHLAHACMTVCHGFVIRKASMEDVASRLWIQGCSRTKASEAVSACQGSSHCTAGFALCQHSCRQWLTEKKNMRKKKCNDERLLEWRREIDEAE